MIVRPNPDEINAVLQALEERCKFYSRPCESDVALAAVRWAHGLALPEKNVPHWLIEVIDAALRKHKAEKKVADEAWAEDYERLGEAWDAWHMDHGDYLYAIESVPNEPDEIAHEGRCVVFIEHNDRTYVSNILTNPTWGEVGREFDQSIEVTRDEHHCYLEGLRSLTVSQWPEWVHNIADANQDVVVYEFCTGS